MAKTKQIKLNKKKQAVIIVATAAILIVVGFGIILAIRNSTIPEFDDGIEISAIVLPQNDDPLHYEWTAEFENPNIVEVIDKTSVDDTEDGETVQFNIKGKNAGTTFATFRYGSFSSGATIQTKRYKIEVNKDLKIRVTEL